ncbi:hypothetical protein MtrunA17_Chr6g0475021 [Medicago truncatula]|uniref:Uncharacterized protein n=1 Tax=Medicago truncatula TaxID=3880 RepID=A0A396HF71_MEDTR|nr:hypothetical protein MtrunA17_Chr6g0475021 [Medicago truncatula]
MKFPVTFIFSGGKARNRRREGEKREKLWFRERKKDDQMKKPVPPCIYRPVNRTGSKPVQSPSILAV